MRDRKKSKKEKGCFIHTNTHTNAQTKKKRRREEKKRQGLAERLAQSPSIAALGKTREDTRIVTSQSTPVPTRKSFAEEAVFD